ncbi:methylisocitrate lyase [Geochorda subterranea]|uniref:Methylisocitrate lyase n=1 Tax=Geochorda subterranea TaxID=3109564 RepID=A0ABZ1BNI1_9FIRM|nr:methylisocitrate lyase [Limnochorda sp. LNt]WRP14366.1 methylisocitrate lyase [Limnochorda sp. LNt]
MPAWLLQREPSEPPGRALRRLVQHERGLMVPGVFNPLVGLIAARLGFRALYFSGAAYSASQALPDLGLFTLTELVQAVRPICRATGLPLIVDADTGFGEALNVVAAVEQLEHAGAAAIQIEDQQMPKRCGHLSGKVVVDAEEMARKVAAAARARRDLLIVARTDARATHGFDEAVRRARLYVEAGADIVFPEALESEEEFEAFARAVDVPLLANMTEFGKTPYIPARRFAEWGYRIVIFPVTTLRIAARAVEEALVALRDTGTQQGLLDRMQSRQELYDLIGYEEYERLDQEVARWRSGA